jgi:hypothetical protein
MKKKNNLKQRCKHCGEIYVPGSSKSAYCGNSCRGAAGRERRDQRDKALNNFIAGLKKNYIIVIAHQEDAIVNVESLKQLGFDRRFLPGSLVGENGEEVYMLGDVAMFHVGNHNFKIVKTQSMSINQLSKLRDMKPFSPIAHDLEQGGNIEANEVKSNDEFKALKKINAQQEQEIIKLKAEAQVKDSRMQIEINKLLIDLMKRPVIKRIELEKLNAKFDIWEGTAELHGVIFKKKYMNPTDYRYVAH